MARACRSIGPPAKNSLIHGNGFEVIAKNWSRHVRTLAQASTIVDAALKKARELKQMPQTVVVLDTGGHVVCAKREDGSGIIRFEIAVGKAYGALGMGWGSRTMMERAAQNPNFLTAIVAASGGRLVPNPGGVLIRDAGGTIIGARRHFRRHRRQ